MEITEIKLLVESELGLGYRSQLVGVDDQAIVHGLPLLLRVVGILLVLFCQIGRQLVAGQSLGYLGAKRRCRKFSFVPPSYLSAACVKRS